MYKGKRKPPKPETLSFEIEQLRRGSVKRNWVAFSVHPRLVATGEDIDSPRREIAAQILERVADDLRRGRRKAGLILSITHSYLKWPTGFQEIAVQVQALREMADELERKCRTKKAPARESRSDNTTRIDS